MRYNYKTHKLIDEGVNFNAIYPEKQEVVKQMTGVDFSLPQIVVFLKKQTDNFEKQMPLATDLDNAIYSVYLKWSGDKSSEAPIPTPTPTPTPSGEGKPNKKTLETRLKIVNAMLKKNPSNAVLKTRIKIIEKQLKSL